MHNSLLLGLQIESLHHLRKGNIPHKPSLKLPHVPGIPGEVHITHDSAGIHICAYQARPGRYTDANGAVQTYTAHCYWPIISNIPSLNQAHHHIGAIMRLRDILRSPV